jgi:thioredoxin reductase (NADPH)
MASPIILTVDDDLDVLLAIERDLLRQYGANYRVVRADSGAGALEVLRETTRRNDAVALLLADQRMPGMTGVEFLEAAMAFTPTARRVLLTAYADTDAAIRAINGAQVDYYLLKPWDPPEERLYPVLTDLLDDWRAAYRPPFQGTRVLGHRWSSETFELKHFMARNHVPYQWLDVEEPEGKQLLAQLGADPQRLPLVLLPDGTELVAPSPLALAERVGLHTQARAPFYDLIIVGAGPAGLAAGVYAASEGLRTVMVEHVAPGGQAGTSSRIENYLGFPSGISGAELARRAATQAQRFGVEILTPREAVALRVQDPYRFVVLSDGTELSAHTVLIATGVSYRTLDVPGLEPLVGMGVFYGATPMESMAYPDQDVYVVGGANSAGQAAVGTARYARTVTLLVRGDSLADTMSNYLIDQITQTPNIRVWTNTVVREVHGSPCLEAVTVEHTGTGTGQQVPAAALFIFIGAAPRTQWLPETVARDPHGFILSGQDVLAQPKRGGWPLERDPYFLESSVPGVFVAGDVRHGATRRVATGVGEGSATIQMVHQYLATV